jgi:hypothetical protein
MSANRLQKIALRVVEKQSISVEDVFELQLALGDEGFVTREEAEAMLRMELMVAQCCDAWAEVFVETITSHVVWECRPTGRVRGEDAAWLRRALAGPRYGAAANIGALLVNVVKEAEEVDQVLIEMAMAENSAVFDSVEAAWELRGAA